jgi:hypothetical protein
MNAIKPISFLLSVVMLTGCASMGPSGGPAGPRVIASGKSTESGSQYAEVGVEFATWGDFVAIVAPTRWANPVKTGGSLSWVNPNAWSEDAGRTGRIFLGEAVILGGVAAAMAGGGGDSGGGPTGNPGGNPGDPPGDGGDPTQ